MKDGAIAFLDALGFKGIWRDKDPQQVLQKLRAIEGEAQRKLLPAAAETDLSLRFFSDTVIICAESSNVRLPPELAAYRCLLRVTAAAAQIASVAAAQPPPPLAFRGAISCGKFEVTEKFLIGPAVDEAAEAEKLAQGALVWFCPTALEVLRVVSQYAEDNPGVAPSPAQFRMMVPAMPYPLPLKGGDIFETWVVNPLAMAEHAQPVGDGILAAMNAPGLNVAIKRQNTSAFLVAALEDRRKILEQIVRLVSQRKPGGSAAGAD